MVNKTFIFYHLPKTGGTTIHQGVLSNCFKTKVLIGGYRHVKEYRNDSGALVALAGHSAQRFVDQNSIVFCVFRDPVQRVVSLFYSLKYSRQYKMDPKLTLEEIFLEKPDIYFGPAVPADFCQRAAAITPFPMWYFNDYLIYLSGQGRDTLVDPVSLQPKNHKFSSRIAMNLINQNTCNAIISNIKNNKITLQNNGTKISVPLVVGVTERMPETIKTIGNMLNLNKTFISSWTRNNKHMNASKISSDKYKKISNELRQEILKRNCFNQSIYDIVIQILKNNNIRL